MVFYNIEAHSNTFFKVLISSGNKNVYNLTSAESAEQLEIIIPYF
jgi:hypothetical protein